MFIQTEETPNPETLKFIPGEEVLGELPSVYFKDSDTAKSSPIALSLFSIEGVCGVYLASDFITVTLKDKDWENTKTEVLSCISCLLYTSPSPRDPKTSRMPSSA